MVFFSSVHGLYWNDKKITAKEQGEKPPDKFKVFYVPMLIVVLEDMTYLFIYQVLVLRYQDNGIPKLSMLCKEDYPLRTTLLNPGT